MRVGRLGHPELLRSILNIRGLVKSRHPLKAYYVLGSRLVKVTRRSAFHCTLQDPGAGGGGL